MRLPSLPPRARAGRAALLSCVAGLSLSVFPLACTDEAGKRGIGVDSSAQGGSGGAGAAGAGGRSIGGNPAPEAGSDGGLSPFCASLARGASFESRDLLWCTAGWYGDAGPPGPHEDPSLYCHWWIRFEGSTARAIIEDNGFWDVAFTCDGSRVEIEGNEAATWDPERRVLTYLNVEFLEAPAADASP